jgi:Predicted membrane protein
MNELREVSTLLFIINLITMLIVVVIIGIAPVITRKSFLFGVRIPEEEAQMMEAVRIKKNYINAMVIGGVLVLAALVIQYLYWPDLSLLAILYLPLLVIALQFIVFVSSWKKAVKLKAKNHWVVPRIGTVDTSSAVQREQIWSFPKVWYVLSALIIIVISIISVIKYPSLPTQIPTHWGFDMQPDVWSDKGFWTVFMMPIIALGSVLVMMLGNIANYRMKLQVSAEHPELSYAQHRIYRRMISEAIGIMALTLTIFMSAVQLMVIDIDIFSTTAMVVLTVTMILACCIPFTYIYIKAGQSGCKLKPDISATETKMNTIKAKSTAKYNRGDDKFWKLGMFYYNEEDPAMLVEDRFGMNSGFNYARTASKVVTALLIIMTIAVYIGTTIMFFVF